MQRRPGIVLTSLLRRDRASVRTGAPRHQPTRDGHVVEDADDRFTRPTGTKLTIVLATLRVRGVGGLNVLPVHGKQPCRRRAVALSCRFLTAR
jgi:hypothetical protein